MSSDSALLSAIFGLLQSVRLHYCYPDTHILLLASRCVLLKHNTAMAATKTASIIGVQAPSNLLLYAADRPSSPFCAEQAKCIEQEHHPCVPDLPSSNLSFGLEIECVFAFHESLLGDLLARLRPGARIIKEIPCEREPLFRRNRGDDRHRSWAIAPADEHSSPPECGLVDLGGDSCHAYTDEPLTLAREVIQKVHFLRDVSVHASLSKQSSYPTWSLQNDSSISGLTKQDLALRFSDRIIEPNLSHWDSWGVELVSPPSLVRDVSTTMRDTGAMLDALRGSSHSSHGALINDQCGFHVHIGHADNSTFDLPTLKHLVYLLIVFEDVLTSLHPESRRQLYSGIDTRRCFISSMRSAFMLDIPVEFVPSAGSPLAAQDQKWESQYTCLSGIRDTIFSAPSADELIHSIQQDRFHTVNMLGLVDPQRPNTIEFRQHSGTLDAVEMAHWVRFCAQLVETAELLAQNHANSPAMALNGLVEEWDDVQRLSLTELGRLMRLSEEAYAHWAAHVERFGPFVNNGLIFEAEECLDFDDFDVPEL